MEKSTNVVLDYFKKISQIPRCSKNEEKIRNWLVNWGKEHNYITETDSVGNVLIRVPGSKGFENLIPIVLQGHMDMVCEKSPDSTHDFCCDPIKLVEDGEWLKADGTTLGADNGIALAMALAVTDDKTVVHPPLELLFTVDEETGLTGAQNLRENWLKGKILLNIDSEDEGRLTIGCAGGRDTDMIMGFTPEKINNKFFYKIIVGGFTGGHSGVNINEQRGNAIKVLFRLINELLRNYELNIIDVFGGSAHNAIPRDAWIEISSDKEIDINLVQNFEELIKKEFSKTDSHLFIKINPSEKTDFAMSLSDSKRLTELVFGLPHGVNTFSKEIEGLVESSNNLAIIKKIDNEIHIKTSQRSSIDSRLDALTYKIESIAQLAGAKVASGNGYPAWEPNWNSVLLQKCKNIYKETFNKDAEIEVIHAGLECGIIGAKYEGMDMISFGPTIQNPHSPDERIKIEDIGKVYLFLEKLLNSFCN